MNFLNLPTGSRRYLEIARHLAGEIEKGEYAAGERLPPERELAQTLDVSRTTVREALLALEIMQMIEIRVGAGVFVRDAASRGAAPIYEPDAAPPSAVLAARRLIEAETAALAAAHATPEQIALMARTNDELAANIDNVAAFDAADAKFHDLIAQAAGNDVLAGFVGHLWRMRESEMWAFWYDQTRHPDNRRRSAEDHRVILRAIERGASDAARTAMQSHLDVLADRFYTLKL
ncbi:MAG: FCD domain-containing protein [Marinovum algicola]|uniref:GntR family transcriptional regulator, uxuAB operon transcriptional repressor n=1 Tax=Marinovum algicola TaxID=42444 RepID=A0A975W6W5_9RHOB|nr:FCD domain-containing protein [Marinovum algicola]AKO96016.1 Transcriptional regulator [Marinovum algicola DG 898]SEI61512.1 GntR family transcriptional regulator, uxuAB operon transcriptional repressor [Marinovum algicola]SLN26026.1 HTH-type transcriptional regulator LutR [Marinovum algicola]